MSTRAREAGPRVVAVAPIPPPLQGAAATTAGILDYIRPHVELRVANVSPGTATGLAYHLTRSWRNLKAMALLVANSLAPGRVLYMTADGGLGAFYNIAVAGLGTLLGYRIFLHHHSFAYVDRHNARVATVARIIHGNGVHVVLCEAMADGLRARYPIRETLELSSAALLPARPRAALRSGGVLRMGFLSNLIIEKGLDTSIALLRAARSEGLPVELAIAGKPYNPGDTEPLELIDRAKAELGDSVSYLGGLSEEAKNAFLQELDVFLFPSRYVNEAQPRAVLEALANGVPVLTVARSCITSDMGSGTGACVPRDADFVAQALPLIRQWATDRGALTTDSQAAQERGEALHANGLCHLATLVEAFRS